MKPTAVEITSWSPYRKIIYQCSNCGQDFRMFGTKERYCHHCGTKVSWNKVMTELPESFDKNDYKGEKALIHNLNKKQLR